MRVPTPSAIPLAFIPPSASRRRAHGRPASGTRPNSFAFGSVVRRLACALASFAARGLAVRRITSDNGSGCVSRVFHEVSTTAAVRHLRTRAYTPRTNGTAERFIQTLQRKWAYADPYHSSAERAPPCPLGPLLQRATAPCEFRQRRTVVQAQERCVTNNVLDLNTWSALCRALEPHAERVGCERASGGTPPENQRREN